EKLYRAGRQERVVIDERQGGVVVVVGDQPVDDRGDAAAPVVVGEVDVGGGIPGGDDLGGGEVVVLDRVRGDVRAAVDGDRLVRPEVVLQFRRGPARQGHGVPGERVPGPGEEAAGVDEDLRNVVRRAGHGEAGVGRQEL